MGVTLKEAGSNVVSDIETLMMDTCLCVCVVYVCVCVCERERERACVRACVRAEINCIPFIRC
jgi:hypothetical protein